MPPSSGRRPCAPCGWSSSWHGLYPISSSSCLRSPSSHCGTSQWDVSCPLWHGDVCEAGRALELWESAVGALESLFFGVALVESPWLPSPPPLLLGLLSEPAADILATNPMHTFLWLCKVEDETKACFRHFPQP